MSLFALSDLHLAISCNKPMDIFGVRWTDYMKKIEENWISVVKENDTVVIPGDISWSMNLEEGTEDFRFLNSLPGTKLISRGNHDYWWATVAKQNTFFEKNGFSGIKPLFNNAYQVGNLMVCGCRGWYNDDSNAPSNSDYDKIVSREIGRLELSFACADKINPEIPKMVFMHFPPILGDYICHPIIECMEKHSVKECYFGHIHGNYSHPPAFRYGNIYYKLISADFLNFKPLLIVE